jgi:hypothetical protein
VSTHDAARPHEENGPGTTTPVPSVPDLADIAAWINRTPTHVLAEVSATIDAALRDPDLSRADIADLRTIAPQLRYAVRRRRSHDRVAAARHALADAGWRSD